MMCMHLLFASTEVAKASGFQWFHNWVSGIEMAKASVVFPSSAQWTRKQQKSHLNKSAMQFYSRKFSLEPSPQKFFKLLNIIILNLFSANQPKLTPIA